MTRSITIVNTSNWDGEDWIIRQRYKSPAQAGTGNVVNAGPWNEVRITPGQSYRSMLGSPNWDVEIEPVESKIPEPFYLSGRQVLPVVLSYVGETPNGEGWN